MVSCCLRAHPAGAGEPESTAWAIPSEKSSFHVFLLMGQSNMAGYGGVPANDPYLPGDQDPVPGVLMLTGQGTVDDAKLASPVEWQPAAHPLHRGQPTNQFGLGMDFAKAYRAMHPGITVGLIPCAWGGAGIDRLGKGTPIFANAVARLKVAQEKGVIKGVLWHQGESDSVNPELAAAYDGKLRNLIADTRSAVGDPNLPFIIGNLAEFYGTHPDHAKRLDLIDQIRATLKSVATRVPGCAFVPSTGLADSQGKGVHFNRASLITLGRRYALAYAQTAPVIVQRPAGYKLVWSDEFDGEKLNTTKWRFPSYKEREAATVNDEGTVTVADGMLKLNAFVTGEKLHAAIIQTNGKFERTYGWFEARMKMHRLQGLHSCFWVQTPTFNQFPNNPAQSGTEMDIMEWFGSGRRSGWAGMNIYYRDEKGSVRSPSIPQFQLMGRPIEGDPQSPLGDMSAEFHIYAMHWKAEAVSFYCDGVEIMRDTEAISNVNQYIVLSLLSSNWERPRLRLNQLPDSLVVDYVRVYAP